MRKHSRYIGSRPTTTYMAGSMGWPQNTMATNMMMGWPGGNMNQMMMPMVRR